MPVRYQSVPSIVTSSCESPLDLVNKLMEVENDENNNLIQILGVIRPSNSSQTTITSLVRGLFTKNKSLLKILSQFAESLQAIDDLNDEKQVFKHFINEFILWCNEGVMILFNKYRVCLESSDLADKNPNDSTYFSKPVMHLSNYIEFIDAAFKVVRNPYIIDQLETFRKECQLCVDTYTDYVENSKLMNINFDQVQLFAETNNIKNYADNVCSYFKITQIVERSRNARLILDNSRNKCRIELLLVNLNGLASQSYNSLALLSIPHDNSNRSLMFPPFRVNELSLGYSNSKCQMTLKSLRFTGRKTPGITDSLIINFPTEDVLADWIRKLSLLFPIESSDSPVNPSFAMKLNESPQIKLVGLGIDMLSDSSHSDMSDVEGFDIHKPSESSPDHPQKNTFKELIGSPSLAAPPQPRSYRTESCSSNSSSIAGFNQPRIPPFVTTSASNASSPTSMRSMGSADSYNSVSKSYYSRASSAKTQDYILQNNLQVQNIRSGVPVTSEQPEERPVSSSAEIEDEEEEKENIRVDAVEPLKPVTAVDDSAHKLSNGSGIDISNFGKSHNPSFSVHKGLNEMLNEGERPKSKILGFFKKGNKTPKLHPSATPKISSQQKTSTNHKNLKIETQIPVDSDSDTIPLSAASVTSGVSTVFQNVSANASTASFTQHRNGSGAAFALPSSTSTYFFKQYKNSNSKSTSDLPEEKNVQVPQHLKDVINDENTIDFYISPSTPKAMKVSKWKAKYGKWEMLTVSESVFAKVVVNYELGSSWLILFKEEYDEEYEEIIDKPIMLLDISQETEITQSAALDVQISAKDSVEQDTKLIMIRCTSNSLAQAILSNVKNVKGALVPKKLKKKASDPSSIGDSRLTIASSMMESEGMGSKSSTFTSLGSANSVTSFGKPYGASQLTRDLSMMSISSEDITNAAILGNPENGKMLLLSGMKIRLQKQLDGYEHVNNPSSWKILSMYSLSIFIISDSFTEKNYYNILLEKEEPVENEDDSFNWLICEEERLDRIERIGKAGLLVKASNDDLFMIECKGKREFKELYEVF